MIMQNRIIFDIDTITPRNYIPHKVHSPALLSGHIPPDQHIHIRV